MNPPCRPKDETVVTDAMTAGLCELRIRHPPGTFALTLASLISLEAIGKHRELLAGHGLDWGSGSGCLAIAAAKIPAVHKVTGLEISEANVLAARENAVHNGVEDKVAFIRSDSYSPYSPADRAVLAGVAGRVNFVLANPPSSEGDDGFEYRRILLRGARTYLARGGVVFLSVSYQYGQKRIERLCEEVSGYAHGGVLASTDWVPFDLGRPDLLHCLHLYAQEERRGGFDYTFQNSEAADEPCMNARAALAFFEKTGRSPLSKWQTHLLLFRG